MRDHCSWSDPSSLGEEDRTAEILDTLFGPHRAVKRLSDAEIAQLVSVALNDALLALGRTYPKRTLESRAEEAQSGLDEQFRALPPVQRNDSTVRAEYRKAVVLQDVTRDLAFRMLNAIQRYAAVSEPEVPNQIMRPTVFGAASPESRSPPRQSLGGPACLLSRRWSASFSKGGENARTARRREIQTPT